MLPLGAIDRIEKIIIDALSKTDKDVLKITLLEMLKSTDNEKIKNGLSKILKTFEKQWWDYDETPQCLSFQYFGINIFNMTNMQYRIAYYQDVLKEVKSVFEKDVFPSLLGDKSLIFILGKIMMGFDDILGDGINFRGKTNADSYYETHLHDYNNLLDIHKEFVKRDCQFLREILKEMACGI